MTRLLRHIYTGFQVILLIVGLAIIPACGGGGGGSTDSAVQVDDIGNGSYLVDPIFVRTGVTSSTVIDQEYRSTVFVGRNYYQQEPAEFELSFNSSFNFLRNLEVEE